MEPLTPNDPLWKLLGQAKPVTPRPNFTQNVLRQARQTPQEKGFLARLRAWLVDDCGSAMGRMAWAGAAVTAVLALALTVPMMKQSGGTDAGQVAVTSTPLSKAPAGADAAPSGAVADVELPPASDAQWADMEQFDSLLAVYDASELTDREIHVLLY